MGFGDFAAALEMRDVLQTMVQAEIEKQRPRIQYATVTSIDRVLRKCGILFPGEALSVTVNMGAVQPSAIGQVVRIDGLAGDRFISDVMGVPYVEEPPSTLLGSGVDLNTITTPGDYIQPLNANSSTILNYPQPLAGSLTVTYQGGTGMVYQRYQIYSGYSGPLGSRVYVRGRYNGVWSAWRALAWDDDVVALDARLDKVDTLSTSSAILTATSGWRMDNQYARRIGHLVHINFQFTRTGSTFGANSTGNIVNQVVAGVNSAWRPVDPLGNAWHGPSSWGPVCGGTFDTIGNMSLAAVPPDFQITTGIQFSGSVTYLQA